MTSTDSIELQSIKEQLASRAKAFGFDALGISSIELPQDEAYLIEWLNAGYHGSMDYMQRHGVMRSRPAELATGTLRVVSVRMNYWPDDAHDAATVLGDGTTGYVSRYALGRDYHKVMRRALHQLAEELSASVGPFGFRVCVDSAPVLEKALARNAGLG